MNNVNVSESELGDTTDSEDESEVLSDDESEVLSDIDDAEIGDYIINEKEKNYKKIIWNLMNRQYLQEQEAKTSGAKVTESKKESRQKRETGAKRAQTAAQKARPTSPKKRPHSKINYDALSEFLEDPLASNSSKKSRGEPDSEQHVGESSVGTLDDDNTGDATDVNKDGENDWENHPNYSHYDNQEEEYNYDDDDEFF